jgi:hypothetical protein
MKTNAFIKSLTGTIMTGADRNPGCQRQLAGLGTRHFPGASETGATTSSTATILIRFIFITPMGREFMKFSDCVIDRVYSRR